MLRSGKMLSTFEVWLELNHGLRTPGEEIAFTARSKINSNSKIFRYGRSIFCLPDRPKFSDFFDLCPHWVSVVRDMYYFNYKLLCKTSKKKEYRQQTQSKKAVLFVIAFLMEFRIRTLAGISKNFPKL